MTRFQTAGRVAALALPLLAAFGSTAGARAPRSTDLTRHHARAAKPSHSAFAQSSPSDPFADLAYDSPLRGAAAPIALADFNMAKPMMQDAAFRTMVPSARPLQTGLASWYGGRRWQGNRMSDGTRFDENELTAAHLSLPLGSRARVTLVGSTLSVVVRITDRPGTHRRIIDLSRAAAAALGILDRGIATVALQPL